MEDIRVTVPGEARVYDVFVGEKLIGQSADLLHVTEYSKILIITDEHIAKLWLEPLQASMSVECGVFIIPAGEAVKRIDTAQRIWGAMREHGCDRKSLVIILGGGVI